MKSCHLCVMVKEQKKLTSLVLPKHATKECSSLQPTVQIWSWEQMTVWWSIWELPTKIRLTVHCFSANLQVLRPTSRILMYQQDWFAIRTIKGTWPSQQTILLVIQPLKFQVIWQFGCQWVLQKTKMPVSRLRQPRRVSRSLNHQQLLTHKSFTKVSQTSKISLRHQVSTPTVSLLKMPNASKSGESLPLNLRHNTCLAKTALSWILSLKMAMPSRTVTILPWARTTNTVHSKTSWMLFVPFTLKVSQPLLTGFQIKFTISLEKKW